MDGRKQEHQNMSYGKATAAVASGAAQWEIEEGKALCIARVLFYIIVYYIMTAHKMFLSSFPDRYRSSLVLFSGRRNQW